MPITEVGNNPNLPPISYLVFPARTHARMHARTLALTHARTYMCVWFRVEGSGMWVIRLGCLCVLGVICESGPVFNLANVLLDTWAILNTALYR
jgi:hypothetical protein